jgi:WD40 repeat protein
LASQALQEIEGSDPERSVLLALEALEHYPYTWQAERALGLSILKNRLRQVLYHDGVVQSATWSADGTKIFTSSEDRTVRIWDAFSGEEIMRITEGDPTLAHWSPDEKYILAVNEKDLIAKVWDTETGLARFTLEKNEIGGALDFFRGWKPWSPSGDHFLIYNKEGELRIWDTESGELLQTLLGHNGRISQAFWSPDGSLIASSGWEDGRVIIWQAATGKVLYDFPGDFEDEHLKMGNWSPSGDRFTTIGRGGAKVYDTATGQQLLNMPVPGVRIWRLIWSPDGSRILTSCQEDGTARLWDAENGQEADRLSGLVQTFGLDWSPTEELAAVGSADSKVHLWHMVTGQQIIELSGIIEASYNLEFSPDGERLLATSSHKVNIYDLTEARLHLDITTHGGIDNPAWSPDGVQIAFMVGFSTKCELKIWLAACGKEIIDLSDPSDMPGKWSAWSPDGDRFLDTRDKNNTVRIWDAATWELLLTVTGQTDIVDHWLLADWSPDGSLVASNTYDPTIVVWNSITGDEILAFSGHQDRVGCIHWSPDGTRILSHGWTGEVMIWEAATGTLLHKLFPEDYNLELAFAAWTKDGNRVVVLSADGFITIFDSCTGEQRSQFFTTSSASSITRFSLSPSGERMIIGGHDGVARVWDLASGTQLLGYEVGGYNLPVYSPDGRWVAIGTTEGNEGKLLVFPTWHSAKELIAYAKEHCVFRELTAEERMLFGLPERVENTSNSNSVTL